MDRITEIWQKTTGVKLIRQALNKLVKKQLIEIRQEIPDQELLAIVNEIMPLETPQEAVNVQSVEIVKAVYKSTEDKIKEAVEYCRDNGIRITVRSVAKQAGVSTATVSRYGYKKR